MIFTWQSVISLSNLGVAWQLMDSDRVLHLNVVRESSIKLLHHHTHGTLQHAFMYMYIIYSHKINDVHVDPKMDF